MSDPQASIYNWQGSLNQLNFRQFTVGLGRNISAVCQIYREKGDQQMGCTEEGELSVRGGTE